MANDRIFLVCKKCGHFKTLYKFNVDTGYIPGDLDALDTFITKHLFECQERIAASLDTDTGFELATEATIQSPEPT